ncbi:uncharacterized protein BJ212DRAFT_1301809 [Suillus subaureus]|uniref:Uncharacterized protein n=1 Tax=Suillus subaureus TaxID=48587 RepID=A0A9P7E5E6_9AGAM|nr:uncharacterized protein BJ212DRAFT_1301809 [Suillus subaureus]KAG1811779.1 hypothetical protein BJ212DRAFT_1301809 [Suillus subaureus]
MNKYSVFKMLNKPEDVKPNISLFNGLNEVKPNMQAATQGLEVSKRPVPPPSRPFHVVIAPGRAREVPAALEIQFPLVPYCQTPGPIKTSQAYLRTLVLERWDAEIRLCEETCRAQLSEHIQGPVAHQNLVQEMITVHWNVEKRRCEESHKVQLLELLLAAHGITTLS